MAARPDLRVGDADREAVADSLREHYAQGRLSLEEFNERLNATFHATTQRDLDEIMVDLPHVRTPVAPLPVAAARPNPGGSGSGNAGPGARGNPLRVVLGFVAVCATLAAVFIFALAPGLWGFKLLGLPGRWGILVAVLLFIRSIFRRIFGRAGWGACSGSRYTGHYHHRGGNGHGRRW
jgi:Domain of unknown function (DUF1707)